LRYGPTLPYFSSNQKSKHHQFSAGAGDPSSLSILEYSQAARRSTVTACAATLNAPRYANAPAARTSSRSNYPQRRKKLPSPKVSGRQFVSNELLYKSN
jgi:hypothetical protein